MCNLKFSSRCRKKFKKKPVKFILVIEFIHPIEYIQDIIGSACIGYEDTEVIFFILLAHSLSSLLRCGLPHSPTEPTLADTIHHSIHSSKTRQPASRLCLSAPALL